MTKTKTETEELFKDTTEVVFKKFRRHRRGGIQATFREDQTVYTDHKLSRPKQCSSFIIIIFIRNTNQVKICFEVSKQKFKQLR